MRQELNFQFLYPTNYFNQQNLQELERKIANFHQREDAILYPSCFDANAGIFEALLSEKDAVFSDELNHASIIDGLRLCKARKHRYRHLDMSGNYIPCRSYDVMKHLILQVSMQCAIYVL